MILTDGQIRDAEMAARRFSGAWTGTSGTLASWVIHLIDTLRHTQEAAMTEPDNTPATPAEQLLRTAIRTVSQRRATYGPPREHFAKTVAAVNAIFSKKLREPLTEADWAQIMILDKLARAQGDAPNPDTTIDLAGYAACLAECEAGG